MELREKQTRRHFAIYDFDVAVAVAEHGSFRKASRQLGIGQAAISRRIQKVEDALGVSLFERHSGGVRLTAAGWQFAHHARRIALDFDAAACAARAAGSADEGHLNLGLIVSLSRGVLRELTADFVKRHPDVDLILVEAERSELLSLLSHRRLDAIVASGAFSTEHGDSLVIARETIYIALSEDHHLASHERLSWDDVQDEQFVVSAREPGPEIQQYLIKRLADLGKPPQITRHKVGREGIMNLVGLGLGISLVADHWRGVRYPNVIFRPIGPESESVPFSILWLHDNDNPALRRFVSLSRTAAKRC